MQATSWPRYDLFRVAERGLGCAGSDPALADEDHARFARYRDEGRVDEACCVAEAIAVRGEATGEQQAYLHAHPPAPRQASGRRLGESILRQHVAHPDQDLLLSCIFGLLAPVIASATAEPLPPPRRHREQSLELARGPSRLESTGRYVLQTLQTPPPLARARMMDPGDSELRNTRRDGVLCPSVVIYRDALRWISEGELTFALGRRLLGLYPPHFLWVALRPFDGPTEPLRQTCREVLDSVARGRALALEPIAALLRARMKDQTRLALLELIERLEARGAAVDVQTWRIAAEHTAGRVGLLLCGELEAARQMITRLAPVQATPALASVEALHDDLTRYSTSEDYFTARRALGIARAPLPSHAQRKVQAFGSGMCGRAL